MWASLSEKFLGMAVEQAGTVQKLADITGIPRSTIQNWQSGTSKPTLDKFGKVMEYIGVIPQRVGQEAVESVSFANIQFEGMDAPRSEDYLAIPVLKNPDLLSPGNYYVTGNNTFITTLASAKYKATKGRKHMVGIFIKDNDMAPLLEPDDVVYVDLDDTQVKEHGHTYLVRDAATNKVCVRRVDEEEEDGDLRLHFSADNPATKPRHYSVKKHYGGDRRAAILGRVIWARIDMRNL